MRTASQRPNRGRLSITSPASIVRASTGCCRNSCETQMNVAAATRISGHLSKDALYLGLLVRIAAFEWRAPRLKVIQRKADEVFFHRLRNPAAKIRSVNLIT